MTGYKPGDVARLLDIKENTLRRWVTEQDFGQYLSSRAQGGSGSHRAYTEQDVRILALIAEMRQTNTSTEEIHASLRSLRSAGWAGLPDIPAAPPGVEPVSMIPREAAETSIEVQRQAWRRELQLLQDRIETLEDELTRERTDRTKAQQELANLRERYGELTGKLSERKSTQFWIIAIGVVVAGAVILTFVLIVVARG